MLFVMFPYIPYKHGTTADNTFPRKGCTHGNERSYQNLAFIEGCRALKVENCLGVRFPYKTT